MIAIAGQLCPWQIPTQPEAHDDILIQNARALYSEGRSWTCKRERQTPLWQRHSKHSVSEKEGLGHQKRALLDVPQKLSGTERVKKVYKGQSQSMSEKKHSVMDIF